YGMVYNHSDSPNAEWEIDDDDIRFVRFTALREIKKGEEILHSYGQEYWTTRKE
ncbi:MAG: SET domain-containing protein-lysine N-methyltransferase, partial [Proteobacteria bacterium]|nr:SET domain-containing protein-lysine N-methyltransferase [Pseudomonadota bacterium]